MKFRIDLSAKIALGLTFLTLSTLLAGYLLGLGLRAEQVGTAGASFSYTSIASLLLFSGAVGFPLCVFILRRVVGGLGTNVQVVP